MIGRSSIMSFDFGGLKIWGKISCFLIQTYRISGSQTHLAASSELSNPEAHKPENGALQLLKSLQLLVGLRLLL